MKASPSFQFYPDRWLGGTSHLSPAARGIYLDLLCWQWNHVKPLPLSVTTRAQIGRCTLEQFSSAWVEISDKFQETPQGFANDALERVRGEGMVFMESQREKARLGAAARWKGHDKHAPANAPGIAPANAPVMPSVSVSVSVSDLDPLASDSESADPATSKIENTRAAVPRARKADSATNNHAKPTNLINGAEVRRHGSHAWCSSVAGRSGLCVPQFLHEEFMGKGNKADPALRAWYAAEIATLAGAAVGDELRWWRSRFAGWVGHAQSGARAATVPDAESTQAYIRGVKS